MENRLVDMRELYQEWQDYQLHNQDNPVSQTNKSAVFCKQLMESKGAFFLFYMSLFNISFPPPPGDAVIFPPSRPIF